MTRQGQARVGTLCLIAAMLAATGGAAFAQALPRAPLDPGQGRLMQALPDTSGLRAPPERGGVSTSSRPAMLPPEPVDALRMALSNAIDATPRVVAPGSQITLINTTNGAFNAQLGGQGGRIVQLLPAQVMNVPCGPSCAAALRIDFHDGVETKYVSLPMSGVGYVILHPLYQRFEIIDATQALRLAGRTR